MFYTDGIDGPILSSQEPAYTVRWLANGERITTYGPDWEAYGPGTKVYHGVDPERI